MEITKEGKYRTISGRVVTLTRLNRPGTPYQFIGDNSIMYFSNGRVCKDYTSTIDIAEAYEEVPAWRILMAPYAKILGVVCALAFLARFLHSCEMAGL